MSGEATREKKKISASYETISSVEETVIPGSHFQGIIGCSHSLTGNLRSAGYLLK